MTKQDKIKKVMDEFKRGTLKTPDGKVVKNRKQALAIAMSESEDYAEKGDLINHLSVNSTEDALDILKGAGTEDLFEKAKHQDGDMHPNGKWVWVASAAGGKGDWRTLNGRVHKKSQAGAAAGSGNTATTASTKTKPAAKTQATVSQTTNSSESKKNKLTPKQQKIVDGFMDKVKTSDSRYSDPSKVTLWKTPKGNWYVKYDGHQVATIAPLGLTEKIAEAAGMTIDREPSSYQSSKKTNGKGSKLGADIKISTYNSGKTPTSASNYISLTDSVRKELKKKYPSLQQPDKHDNEVGGFAKRVIKTIFQESSDVKEGVKNLNESGASPYYRWSVKEENDDYAIISAKGIWGGTEFIRIDKSSSKTKTPTKEKKLRPVGTGTLGPTKRENTKTPKVKLSLTDFSKEIEEDDEFTKNAPLKLHRYTGKKSMEYYDNKGNKQTATPFIHEFYASSLQNKIGGYEIYFDKADTLGTFKTLNEAINALENWINKMRVKGHPQPKWIYNQNKGKYQMYYSL